METIAYKIFYNPNIKLKKIIDNNDIITHDILCDSLESITNNKTLINNIRNDKMFKENFVNTFEKIWIESLSKNSILHSIDEDIIYKENYICKSNKKETNVTSIEQDWVSL